MLATRGRMTVRTISWRCLCTAAFPERNHHRYAAPFVIRAVRLNRSTKRFDDRDTAATLRLPIGWVSQANAGWIKARPGVMHGHLQRIVGPVKFGTERPGSVPLHVADQLSDDLFNDLHVARGFRDVGNVSSYRRAHVPQFAFVHSRIGSPAHRLS